MGLISVMKKEEVIGKIRLKRTGPRSPWPLACREPVGLETCRRAQIESPGAERPQVERDKKVGPRWKKGLLIKQKPVF